MARINDHYLKLSAGYLFPEIGRRVREFQANNSDADLIRLGIGDVVLPLPEAVREAMHRAIDELGTEEGFRGYGPEQGYEFLREAIAAHEFGARGVEISPDEIFVSDGSKCDSGNIQEIFAASARVAIPDPVYPVYLDTNVMAGRSGPAGDDGRYDGIVYLPCTEENGFTPEPPSEPVDLVYLCSPNNPTGTAARRGDLVRWVDYARETGAVLLYDAAYEAFISDPELPHSIYEVPGAREVAIEFRSFSKKAGFTGVRCGFLVVPAGLRGRGRRRRRSRDPGALGPPALHQVQRRLLPGAGRRRGLLRRGRPRAARGQHRLLHAERAHHPRRDAGPGPDGPRRHRRALRLDPHARRHRLVGLLRPAAEPSTRGRDAGRGLRELRRGLP